MPFAFYDAVIAAERRRPVFGGQLAPSRYTDALRRRYPDARFLPTGSAAADFQTLRCAPRLVLSISSFAWLAGVGAAALTARIPLAMARSLADRRANEKGPAT